MKKRNQAARIRQRGLKQGSNANLKQWGIALLLSIVVFALFLTVFAALLSFTSIPIKTVGLFSCIAAAAGIFTFGHLIAFQKGKKYLLWGAGIGIFFCIVKIISIIMIDKNLTFDDLQAFFPLMTVFALSGIAGGVTASLRR